MSDWEVVTVTENGRHEIEDTYRLKAGAGWLYRIRQWSYTTATGEPSNALRMTGMNTIYVPEHGAVT